MVGDFEMWHRLAQSHKVVLMPHGMVWYREHGEQEINNFRQFITAYEGIKIKYLRDKNCPLEAARANKILAAQKKSLAGRVMQAALKLDMGAFKSNMAGLKLYHVK